VDPLDFLLNFASLNWEEQEEEIIKIHNSRKKKNIKEDNSRKTKNIKEDYDYYDDDRTCTAAAR
jgi:hypothetical protein